ncbi:MAG: hypothetical protein PVF49_13105 [Anaerolineales bacterium]
MDPFILKIIISFVAGGLWISAVTYLAERLGTSRGGLVAGLPSTVVLAMLFIGWTQGPEMVFQTTTAFPATFGALGPFLLVVSGTLGSGLGIALGGAFLVWGALQWLIIASPPPKFGLAAVVWAGLSLLSLSVMLGVLKLQPRSGRRIEYSTRQMLMRAVFSGAVIAGSVLASRLGGPVWGSVFSGFPAVFTTSLVITYHSLGEEFARSMTLPLLASAMVNCMIFVTVLRWTVLLVGVWAACLIAYAASILSAYLLYRFFLSRWR